MVGEKQRTSLASRKVLQPALQVMLGLQGLKALDEERYLPVGEATSSRGIQKQVVISIR